jgi:amidase
VTLLVDTTGTTNPWSAAHTPGGSSGGEGVLLAVDGVALSVGSDVGGSIRILLGYCGIFGLKPGQGRMAYGGAVGECFVITMTLQKADRTPWS